MTSTQENNLTKAKISVSALVIAWVSIPAFIIVPYLAIIIPNYIRMHVSGEIADMITESLSNGIEMSAFDVVKQELFGEVNPILSGIIGVVIGTLIFAWLCWATVYTLLHFNYSLSYSDSEVFAKAGRKKITIPFKKMTNIYVEQSLWGKLFRYGSIVITSSIGSVTVKSVANARVFAKKLASVSLENENTFLNI